MYSKEKINSLVEQNPILKRIMALEEEIWLNPHQKLMKEMPCFSFDMEDIEGVEALWKRFAPFFVRVFPETIPSNGKLESPLVKIDKMQQLLSERGEIPGNLYLKCDNDLPIAGSIKARGGFFEVLHYAEKLALQAGLLSENKDYSVFASEEFREFFSRYKIGVGSTGNLGLSIGIISAALGFRVTVYMSSDAKEWKKDLLREKGVKVMEFEGDFSEAIVAGRNETQADPKAYFVDDENSNELFLGYSLGALRLAEQLKEKGIKVDENHPLFVYSPCGVGGSPGGTAFGLKQIFGDHVHCFFVEPTHSPSVMIALITGEMSNISVQDLGIDNRTEADGLAVGRASNFATQIISHIVSGIYTIKDKELFVLLAQLEDSEDIFLEPSATAGLVGPLKVAQTDYAEKHNLQMENTTHVVWATGGSLVPEEQRKEFYNRGKKAEVI